jgi:hypothetical protein
MGRLSGQAKAQLMKSPEYKAVLNAVQRDKSVQKAIEEIARDGAESMWNDRDRERAPEVPDSFEELNDEAYGSMLVTDYVRGNSLRKVLDAYETLGMSLDPRADEEDVYQVLDQPIQMMLDGGALSGWEQTFEGWVESAMDQWQEEKDPYAYRGLSRSDFMASVSRVAARHLK